MNYVHKNTDVLVIGGGSAGCWAAIRAKAFAPSVTLVDKAVIARSGSSSWSNYVLASPPEKELSSWKRQFVEREKYLCEQDWVDIILAEHGQRLADMESWGVPFERDEKGNIIIRTGRGHKDSGFVICDSKKRMEILKNKARELGVNIIERVLITDLLTSDGHLPTSGSVIGALGFHSRTGETVAIKSKAVIITSGGVYHGESNLTGDGTAIAFRAGAELMSMEFCTKAACWYTDGKHALGNLSVLFQGLGMKILNSKGERFMEKYDPVLMERTDWNTLAQALAKETLEGRGPAIMDMSQAKAEDIAFQAKLQPGRMKPFLEAGIDWTKDRLLVVAKVGIGSSSGEGGIKIDIQGRTSIPGLYGAGSACKNRGTYSVGGGQQAFCYTSGYRAGESAAKDSLKARDLPLEEQQAENLRREIFSPLEKQKGTLPDTLFKEISKITEPALRSIIKRADRIKETMEDLDSLEKKELKEVRARDYHELVRANGVKNLALLSKLVFRSALEREESRDAHYRQDYPYRDTINWLKWVLIKQDSDGGMKVWTEPIPFERYEIQPERRIIPSPLRFD